MVPVVGDRCPPGSADSSSSPSDHTLGNDRCAVMTRSGRSTESLGQIGDGRPMVRSDQCPGGGRCAVMGPDAQRTPATATMLAAGASGPPPRPPLPLSLRAPAAHAFVGRADALATLERSWQLAGSAGQIVLIGGEAGSGKTRLTAEFARLAHRSGATVLLGSCDDDLAVPYQPWVQAVEQLLAALPTSTMAGELAPLSPLLAHGERLEHDRAVLPVDPESARYRLYEAFGVALREAAARWPTVVVLEDLHWAGVQTLALLRHVARSGLPSGLLVVGTFRDTSDEITEPLTACLADLRRVDAVTRLRLGGLDGEADRTLRLRGDRRPARCPLQGPRYGARDAQLWQRLLHRRAVATPRRQWSGRCLGRAMGRPAIAARVRRSCPTASARSLPPVSPSCHQAARTMIEVAAVAGQRIDLGILAMALDVPADGARRSARRARLGASARAGRSDGPDLRVRACPGARHRRGDGGRRRASPRPPRHRPGHRARPTPLITGRCSPSWPVTSLPPCRWRRSTRPSTTAGTPLPRPSVRRPTTRRPRTSTRCSPSASPDLQRARGARRAGDGAAAGGSARAEP